jgi:hypothetical protein
VVALGPRASLFSLLAAGLEEVAIGGLELHGSFGSLKEVLEQNGCGERTPEVFCFGLLEAFDILQLAALSAPRPVVFRWPSERARRELTGLRRFYSILGVEFQPLQKDRS